MTEQLFHPPSADDPAPQDLRTPGAVLRKLREEAGLSHTAVGSALHLTVHYIKALENDEYGKLPGLTFVKGYLRAYARFLKTDVDAVLECFDQHIASMVDAGQRTQQVQRSRRRQDQALRWAFATGFIIVAGLIGGWWYTSLDNSDPAVAGGSAASQPVQVSAATIAAPANTAQQIPANSPGLVQASPGALTPVEAANQRSALQAAAGTEDLAGTVAANDPRSSTLPTEELAGGKLPEALLAGSPVASNLAPVTVEPAQVPVAQVAGMDPQTNTDTAAVQTSPQQVPSAEASAALAAAGAEATETAAGTITRGNLTIVSADAGTRLLTLAGSGQDLLQLSLHGNSWVEIEDGAHARLYNDMLRAGDALTVQGAAPFYVLLGDAHQVEVKLNSQVIDIVTSIRNDNTARLVLDDAEQTDGVTH